MKQEQQQDEKPPKQISSGSLSQSIDAPDDEEDDADIELYGESQPYIKKRLSKDSFRDDPDEVEHQHESEMTSVEESIEEEQGEDLLEIRSRDPKPMVALPKHPTVPGNDDFEYLSQQLGQLKDSNLSWFNMHAESIRILFKQASMKSNKTKNYFFQHAYVASILYKNYDFEAWVKKEDAKEEKQVDLMQMIIDKSVIQEEENHLLMCVNYYNNIVRLIQKKTTTDGPDPQFEKYFNIKDARVNFL